MFIAMGLDLGQISKLWEQYHLICVAINDQK